MPGLRPGPDFSGACGGERLQREEIFVPLRVPLGGEEERLWALPVLGAPLLLCPPAAFSAGPCGQKQRPAPAKVSPSPDIRFLIDCGLRGHCELQVSGLDQGLTEVLSDKLTSGGSQVLRAELDDLPPLVYGRTRGLSWPWSVDVFTRCLQLGSGQ